MKEELVTIIIPAYNHENFIENCLDSIIEQTYKSIELIIINDGSYDNTHEKIVAYEKKLVSKFVNYIYLNKKNEGISKTLNIGLDIANGEYIVIFASDDIMLSNRIEKQVEFLQTNKDFDIVYSDCYDIKSREYLSYNVTYDLKYLMSKMVSFPNGDIFEFMIDNVFKMPTPTVMYKKKCFNIVGNFDENIFCEDPDMFIRTSKHFRYGYIDEPLVIHRIHSYNSGRNDEIIKKSIKSMIEKYSQSNFLNANQKNRFITLLNKTIGNIDMSLVGEKKIIVWGTGNSYLRNRDINRENIEFFIDSNKDKQKKVFQDKIIYGPDKLKDINKNEYYIFVLSQYYDEIYNVLEEYGFKYKENFN